MSVRPPQVRTQSFIPSIRHIYCYSIWVIRTSFCLANSSNYNSLICDSCSSDRKFAIRLPSDSTSRWTPLS